MARTDRNEVLGDPVPSLKEVQKDVLEWWCHVVLQECSSPELYSKRVEACHELMEQLTDDTAYEGRLYNRTQLASLCSDFVDRPIVPLEDKQESEQDEEEDDDESNVPLSKLSPEKWEEYIQQLEEIRGDLLRKDANVSEGEDVNEEIDTDLEALPKFQQDYQTVSDLLKLCRLVAQFHTDLDKLATSKAEKQATLLQKVEKAVDDYKKALEILEFDTDATDKLTSFLLADMYKAKPKDLAQRLQDHVLEVMTDDEYELCYAQIVQKTRRLLCRWHSQVLDVPKLCRLGYGGFVKRKSSIVEDNVSVSSWGVDEDEYKERKAVAEESDDLEGYATAPDDATADPEEADAAFAFSTQPPAPETPEQKKQSEDDGDKKPRAKRKISQQEQEESDTEPSGTSKQDARRRSSRRTKNTLPPRMATRSKPASKSSTETSPPPKKKARAALKSPAQGGDELMTQPDSSPPRKQAAVARKPPEDDESITEPESTPPRKMAAVARKPPANDNSDTDSEPSPPKRKKAARRASKKPTVIEWSDSEDDEVPTMPKRPAHSSVDLTTKPKAPRKRRRFSDEEKEAIRAGVHRYGAGQWALIRQNSNGVLLSRTNVNIKVRQYSMTIVLLYAVVKRY